jgi:hypothetical protein
MSPLQVLAEGDEICLVCPKDMEMPPVLGDSVIASTSVTLNP